MVVSAILTTALAPITGALFGASYGTSIRIGYEIIFPALFGKIDAKSKQDAQTVIKSLHEMFTATGGVSAMEFGISQGIDMAKKKTESPEVINLINTDLGITDEQIRRISRGLTVGADSGSQLKEEEEVTSTAQWDAFNTSVLDKTHDIYTRNFTANQIQTVINDYKTRNPNKKAVIIQRMNDRRDEVANIANLTDYIPGPEPTGKDEQKRDWDAVLLSYFSPWTQSLTLYTKKLSLVSQYQSQRTPSKKFLDKLKRDAQTQKNLTLDLFKKMTNWLTLQRNNPITRPWADSVLRQLPSALG